MDLLLGVNVGLIDGEFTINAGPEEMERSLINLEVAGTKEAINMVEADAKKLIDIRIECFIVWT